MTEPRPWRSEMPKPPEVDGRPLRIGDKVRCIATDDPFIDYGTEGLVVNVAPPRPYAPGRARILWSTDQLCMMDATDFEIVPKPNDKPQQPVVMDPFPGSAA